MAAPTGPALSLVLPAYNEQARLPYTLTRIDDFLDSAGLTAEVIVVDNGSADATSGVVHQAMARSSRLKLIRTDRRGKGLAVRTGMLAAVAPVRVFGDADLSWSLEDLTRFSELVSSGRPVVIGSREGQDARRVGEPGYRHLMGRVFNRLVQAAAVPGIEDTQCGFKAFSAEAAEAVFRRLTIEGFGFDVEALYLCRALGYSIEVVPLRWEHKENSRVQPFQDTVKMLRDVLKVRWNALSGAYDLS